MRVIHTRESFQLCYGNQNAPANSPKFQLPVRQQVIDRSDAERESDCGLLAAHQQLCVRWHRLFGGRLFPSLPAPARRDWLPNRAACGRCNLSLGLRWLQTNLVIGSAFKCGRLGLNGVRQLVLRGLIRLQETF